MADSPSLFVLGSFVAACSVHVARFPQRGESANASAFTVETGGKGLNLAIGARRLGATVDGLIAVGDDVFGRMAAPALAAAGLPDAMLCQRDGPTGAGVGFIDATGETCLAVYPGANARLTTVDVGDAATRIARARLVLAQFEIPDAPIAAAFAMARAGGAVTILNPSPFRAIDAAILRDTTILVVNEVEADALTGSEGPDRFDAVFAQGPRTVVLTRGGRGALACHADGTVIGQPAFAVAATDTLGAGDAFTAGLATALLDGRVFAGALRRAAACGAITACRTGVLGALPTSAELDLFLAARTAEAPTTEVASPPFRDMT